MRLRLASLLLCVFWTVPATAQVTFTGAGGPAQVGNSARGNPLMLNFPRPNPAHQPTEAGFIAVEDSTLLLHTSPDTVVMTDSRPFHVGPEPATVQVNLLAGGRFINAGVAPDPRLEFDVTASIVGQASTAERSLGPLQGTAETVFQIPAHSALIPLQPGNYRLQLRAVWKAAAASLPAAVRAKFAAGRIEVFMTPVVAPTVDGVFGGASEGWVLVADDVKEVQAHAEDAGAESQRWPIRLYTACDREYLYFAVVQPKVRPNAANTGPVTVGAFQILWNTQGDAAPDAELAVSVPSFSVAGAAGSVDNIGILRIGTIETPIAGDRAVKNQAAVGQASVVEYRVPRAQLAGLDLMPFTYDSEGQGEEGARNLGISANAIGDVMDPAAWAGFDYRPSACNRPPECLSAAPSVATLWPADGAMVPVTINGVTDPDGDPVTVAITAIRQDEPEAGGKAGITAPDGTGLGTATAHLRAERIAGSSGRVYTVFFRATDNHGGQCSGSVKVSVPIQQGGSYRDDGPRYDSTAQ
jgi:hypothetical protein